MIARGQAESLLRAALSRAGGEHPEVGREAARLVDAIYGVIGADATSPPEVTVREGRR